MEERKMKEMTSAFVSKMIKSLEEDKLGWLNKEHMGSTYVVSVDEEPVIPEYNYEETRDAVAAIDAKVAKLRHALNLANATAQIKVGDEVMSVDTILIKMAQLNQRKFALNDMRNALPKTRVTDMISSRKAVAEYRYINYDIETVKADYEKVNEAIMEMQMALDTYNQTVTFEVDI